MEPLDRDRPNAPRLSIAILQALGAVGDQPADVLVQVSTVFTAIVLNEVLDVFSNGHYVDM